MTTERYGWHDAKASCSHDYLLPVVKRRLADITGRVDARVVDFGCGNGYVSAELTRLGYRVVGFDAALDGIEQARAAHPDVQFQVASVYDDDLPARLGSNADCVVSLEVVEHLYYPRKLFSAAHSLLRLGGGLIVSTPYHGYLKNLALSVVGGWDRHFHVGWDGGHIKFFSPKTLRRMAEEAGFGDLRIEGVGRLPGLYKSMILSGRRR